MPLLFYPPVPCFQASYHSVTVEVVNNMLFIGTPFSVTHWSIFIQRCRSCMCQYWSPCGTHFFPIFRRWHSLFRKYLAGVMICELWLILPMMDCILSVFISVEDRDALVFCNQSVYFSLGINTRRERVWMYQPRQVLYLAS